MTHAGIPCTALLLTRNSEKTLRVCLEGLKNFSEVLILDGFSTDATRSVASQFPNVRILNQDRKFLHPDESVKDFAQLRNSGIEAATYGWIFIVDSDEIIQANLSEEICLIANSGQPGAYQVFRRFLVNGERIERSAGYPAYQIRLFHRSVSKGFRKAVHERLDLVPGTPLQTLESELLTPLAPLEEVMPKYQHYLAVEVERLGVLPWGEWLYWVLWRNLRSVVGLLLKTVIMWFTFGTGKRMPFAYDWRSMRYLLQAIWVTFPLRVRRLQK